MNFDFSPEQLEFAAEVERFLDANDDPEVFDVTRENMAQIVDTPKRRAFMASLGEKGWLGITWPKEWGGQDSDGVFEYLRSVGARPVDIASELTELVPRLQQRPRRA